MRRIDTRGIALHQILIFGSIVTVGALALLELIRNNYFITNTASTTSIVDIKREFALSVLGDRNHCKNKLIFTEGYFIRDFHGSTPIEVFLDIPRQNSVVKDGETVEQIQVDARLESASLLGNDPLSGNSIYLTKLNIRGNRAAHQVGSRTIAAQEISLAVTVNSQSRLVDCDANPSFFGEIEGGRSVLDCLDQNGYARFLRDGKRVCMIPNMDVKQNAQPICPSLASGWKLYKDLSNSPFTVVSGPPLNAVIQTACIGNGGSS